MKKDLNGCSTCQRGKESYEKFFSKIAKRYLVQYDYRTENGRLFTTIKGTLEDCRRAKDKWLENN